MYDIWSNVRENICMRCDRVEKTNSQISSMTIKTAVRALPGSVRSVAKCPGKALCIYFQTTRMRSDGKLVPLPFPSAPDCVPAAQSISPGFSEGKKKLFRAIFFLPVLCVRRYNTCPGGSTLWTNGRNTVLNQGHRARDGRSSGMESRTASRLLSSKLPAIWPFKNKTKQNKTTNHTTQNIFIYTALAQQLQLSQSVLQNNPFSPFAVTDQIIVDISWIDAMH